VRTLVLEPQQQSQNKQRACNDLDVACNGATHPQTAKAQPNGLQQARHSIPRNGIYHRLTFENPAGHRKSQRRVTNMHEPHSPTPQSDPECNRRTLGEEATYTTNLANGQSKGQCPKGATS